MRVAVGLSGGVDSSVTITLLKSQGYDVLGLTMKIYDGSIPICGDASKKHACYGPGEEEDIETCKNLCKQLNVPYHVIDLSKEYLNNVIGYFKGEYLAGRTPNPCVRCNLTMKFGFLIERAKQTGIQFDYFATGHYARIKKIGNEFYLQKAVDPTKDQTYFIHSLSSEVLSHTMFPLGGFTKKEVREIAKKFNLPVSEKPDSQDFIDGGDYSVLFNEKFQPGNIVDENGTVLGRHTGIINYTIGQRKGLGITSEKPLYVKEIDPKRNVIVVTDNSHLFKSRLIAKNAQFRPFSDAPIYGKIRQKSEPALVYVKYNNGEIDATFDNPQRGITPGQFLVLYQEDCVVGYGTIEQ